MMVLTVTLIIIMIASMAVVIFWNYCYNNSNNNFNDNNNKFSWNINENGIAIFIDVDTIIRITIQNLHNSYKNNKRHLLYIAPLMAWPIQWAQSFSNENVCICKKKKLDVSDGNYFLMDIRTMGGRQINVLYISEIHRKV